MASLAGLRNVAQRSLRTRLSPIGLEFAEDRLNAAQFAHGEPPVLRAQASVPYPVARAELLRSPAALKGFLKQIFKTHGFSGRKVVTTLPSEDVRVLSVTYQVRQGQSDDLAIAKLMEERVGEDLSQFVIDYMPIRGESHDGDRLAMVLLCERGAVVTYLEQLRKAGLDVEALEVNLVSIRRWISTVISADETLQNVLVVNTGATKTQLTMVSGQRLLFEQQVDFGEDPLLAQVSMALDTPQDVTREIVFRRGVHPTAEATAAPGDIDDTLSSNMILTIVRPQFSNLVAEIRRAVLFASSETRGGDVGRVYLMGSVAQWPGAADLLESLAAMPVSIAGPVSSNSAPGTKSEPMPELVIPSGLALRGFADA